MCLLGFEETAERDGVERVYEERVTERTVDGRKSFGIGGDHPVVLQYQQHATSHGVALSSSCLPADETDTLSHFDGVDGSSSVSLRCRSLPFLGLLIGKIDRFQRSFDATVEHPVAARPAGLILGMPGDVLQSVPLLASRGVKKARRRLISFRAHLLEQTVEPSLIRRVLLTDLAIFNGRLGGIRRRNRSIGIAGHFLARSR